MSLLDRGGDDKEKKLPDMGSATALPALPGDKELVFADDMERDSRAMEPTWDAMEVVEKADVPDLDSLREKNVSSAPPKPTHYDQIIGNFGKMETAVIKITIAEKPQDLPPELEVEAQQPAVQSSLPTLENKSNRKIPSGTSGHRKTRKSVKK